jgi:NADH:ubiquinone oxidoreductase subunit 5 (subunit L)/multisubunit Na+/H+ antiporter MnhA subunit
MAWPLVALAIPSILFGVFNIPGVELPGIGNFSEWLAVRVVPMGDHHPEAIDWRLAGSGLFAALAGIALGWRIWGKDRATQAERDRFEIPVFYPLLRQKYYMDHLALGLVGATTGPIARLVNWVNDYVIDGVVNAVAFSVKALGSFTYGIVDQRGVDGIFNGLAATTDGSGSAVRRWQTGRVQQYAASFVGGALILIVLFVFVI